SRCPAAPGWGRRRGGGGWRRGRLRLGGEPHGRRGSAATGPPLPLLGRRGPGRGTVGGSHARRAGGGRAAWRSSSTPRSEEHTSELQSREKLVCRLLLEIKK